MWDPGTRGKSKGEGRDVLSGMREVIIPARCSLVLWNLDLGNGSAHARAFPVQG